ncbi:unnamed protein product [Caenorhabditis bovis]|uniref:Uncharacterized protein n=1 Tax=Caenorhabditis bovis TaxID=2654633 RepID=A0A8S1EP10_9PELO|nr:unnamed protein product [Caenorhabditis bovis]
MNRGLDAETLHLVHIMNNLPLIRGSTPPPVDPRMEHPPNPHIHPQALIPNQILNDYPPNDDLLPYSAASIYDFLEHFTLRAAKRFEDQPRFLFDYESLEVLNQHITKRPMVWTTSLQVPRVFAIYRIIDCTETGDYILALIFNDYFSNPESFQFVRITTTSIDVMNPGYPANRNLLIGDTVVVYKLHEMPLTYTPKESNSIRLRRGQFVVRYAVYMYHCLPRTFHQDVYFTIEKTRTERSIAIVLGYPGECDLLPEIERFVTNNEQVFQGDVFVPYGTFFNIQRYVPDANNEIYYLKTDFVSTVQKYHRANPVIISCCPSPTEIQNYIMMGSRAFINYSSSYDALKSISHMMCWSSCGMAAFYDEKLSNRVFKATMCREPADSFDTIARLHLTCHDQFVASIPEGFPVVIHALQGGSACGYVFRSLLAKRILVKICDGLPDTLPRDFYLDKPICVTFYKRKHYDVDPIVDVLNSTAVMSISSRTESFKILQALHSDDTFATPLDERNAFFAIMSESKILHLTSEEATYIAAFNPTFHKPPRPITFPPLPNGTFRSYSSHFQAAYRAIRSIHTLVAVDCPSITDEALSMYIAGTYLSRERLSICIGVDEFKVKQLLKSFKDNFNGEGVVRMLDRDEWEILPDDEKTEFDLPGIMEEVIRDYTFSREEFYLQLERDNEFYPDQDDDYFAAGVSYCKTNGLGFCPTSKMGKAFYQAGPVSNDAIMTLFMHLHKPKLFVGTASDTIGMFKTLMYVLKPKVELVQIAGIPQMKMTDFVAILATLPNARYGIFGDINTKTIFNCDRTTERLDRYVRRNILREIVDGEKFPVLKYEKKRRLLDFLVDEGDAELLQVEDIL